MARKPDKPWYWTAQDVWVVQIGGKRHRLAKGKKGRGEAFARFHQIMAEAGKPVPEGSAVPLVGELVVLRLRDLRVRRDTGAVGSGAKDDVVRRLAGFADMHGDLRADQIKPHHVDEWLATKPGWGKTSRHDGAGAVKSVFKWAAKKGLIDRNPLAEMEKPRRVKRREVIPTPVEIRALLAAPKIPELQDLLVFIFGTGCRPKEARTLEAKHLDRANGLAVLAQHKTADKTDRPRVLYLTGEAEAVAYRLADARPTGPIFLNSQGSPWTHNAVGLALRRLRKREGLPDSVVAYALRHAYATDALAHEVPAAFVAEMMGHADLRMMATYSHVNERTDALKEAARKVRGGSSRVPEEG